MKELTWTPSLSKLYDPSRIEYEVQCFNYFFEVTPWSSFAISCRLSVASLMVTGATTFLKLVQTASRKCSVLLR